MGDADTPERRPDSPAPAPPTNGDAAAAPPPARRRGLRLLLAAFALLIAGAAVVAWLVVRSAERLAASAAQALRVEVREALSTSLSGLSTRDESFLVAWQFGTTLHEQDEREVFWGFLPVAESTVEVQWSFTVDYGVDLSQAADPFGALRCESSENACAWTVPPPTHRPPAIDTNTVRMRGSRSLLFSQDAAVEHREQVLRRLTHLTRQELGQPGFQNLVRPSVREGLERLAERVVATAWEGPGPAPRVRVVFEDETDGDATGDPEDTRAAPRRIDD